MSYDFESDLVDMILKFKERNRVFGTVVLVITNEGHKITEGSPAPTDKDKEYEKGYEAGVEAAQEALNNM
jgi:hypothetical protein